MILGHTKQLAEKSTEPGFDELFAIGPLIGNIVWGYPLFPLLFMQSQQSSMGYRRRDVFIPTKNDCWLFSVQHKLLPTYTGRENLKAGMQQLRAKPFGELSRNDKKHF